MKRFTLQAQFLVICALFFLVVAGLGITCWTGQQRLGSLLTRVIEQDARKSAASESMRATFQAMRAESRGAQISVMTRHFETKSKLESECSSCHNGEKVSEHRAEFGRLASQVHAELDGLERRNLSASERQQAGKVRAAVKDWNAAFEEYLQLAAADNFDGAHEVATTRVQSSIEQAGGAAMALVKAQEQAMIEARNDAESGIVRGRLITSTLFLFGLATSIGIAWLLRRLALTMRQSADGMNEGATALQAAAEQISQASESVAEGAVRQSEILQAASLDADHLRTGATASLTGLAETVQSGHAVGNRVAVADKALDAALGAMEEMISGSQKISRIIKTIDEIAFQTNLLALNAAVEAARAGEAGLGFAVVAEEVRTLARRCAEASQETGSLVSESISATRNGRQQVDSLAAAIRAITADMTLMLERIEEVKREGERQTAGIGRTATSFDEIARMTQQTSAAAEESASAAAELTNQAEHLSRTAGDVRSFIGG